MFKIINSKLASFYKFFLPFILGLILLTSAVFLGGNTAEYRAFFNSVITLTIFIAIIPILKYSLTYIYVIAVPLLIFCILFFSYRTNLYLYAVNGSLSDLDMTRYIIKNALFSPFGNMAHLAYWVSIFLISVIAFIVAHRKGLKQKFTMFFWIISVLIALYGIIVYATGNTMILWYAKNSYLNELTATFINRNSYATFAGCGFLTGLYYIHQAYLQHSTNYRGTYQTRLAGMIDFIASYKSGYVLFSFLIFIALFLTNSRAGISLTIVFASVFYFLISRKQNLTQKTTIFFVALVIFVLIAPIIFQKFLDRAVMVGESSIIRTNTYKIMLDMIMDYKIFGVGLGGFEYAFHAYRDNTIPIEGYWDKGHSTLLEIIVEIGIPLSVMLFSFYVYLFSVIIKSYRRFKQDFLVLCLTICGLCITHSLVDFSLQIPAINILFHTMLAFGFAEAKCKQHS